MRIDRPERRNAIDSDTAERLHDELLAFEADDTAGVAVLTGDEQAFCAGADLKDLPTLRPSGPLGPTRLQLSKPVIAAVEGWCVAGGLELAAWCDLRVAGAGARFGCLERRWGVPLIDGGTYRLPRIVGLGRALDCILTGREVDAAEAEPIGFANRVVPERHGAGRRGRAGRADRRAALELRRPRPAVGLRGPRARARGGAGQRGPPRAGGRSSPPASPRAWPASAATRPSAARPATGERPARHRTR